MSWLIRPFCIFFFSSKKILIVCRTRRLSVRLMSVEINCFHGNWKSTVPIDLKFGLASCKFMQLTISSQIHVYLCARFLSDLQTINESLNCRRRKHEFPQEFILVNGNINSDLKKIANAFNDYFVNIGDTCY